MFLYYSDVTFTMATSPFIPPNTSSPFIPKTEPNPEPQPTSNMNNPTPSASAPPSAGHTHSGGGGSVAPAPSNHDSVGEATATSRAVIVQPTEPLASQLPPSVIYVTSLQSGQPTQVNYATQKVVVDEWGLYKTATGERVNIVERTTSVGTHARIPTSGQVATPVSNKFYAQTPAGMEAMQQDVALYNAKQEWLGRVVNAGNQAVANRMFSEYTLPEQSSLVGSDGYYNMIGTQALKEHPILSQIKTLWQDFPTAIASAVAGKKTEQIGKTYSREAQARSEGFFGNIAPETIKFLAQPKMNESQVKEATQPFYTAPRWDFTKGSFTEATMKEPKPFVATPEYTGQLMYSLRSTPVKVLTVLATSQALGSAFGYAETIAKGGEAGKFVQTVAGVSKASNILLPVVAVGVGKGIYDVYKNPTLKPYEKAGLVGETALEVGAGVYGYMAGFKQGTVRAKQEITESDKVFTTATSKELSATEFRNVVKNGEVIGIKSTGEVIGTVKSKMGDIKIKTDFIVPSDKLNALSTKKGNFASVEARGLGVTHITKPVEPTIVKGTPKIPTKETVTEFYGTSTFKTGALIKSSEATRTIPQPQMEYAGVKVSAPKEIVAVKGFTKYEGGYIGKVASSEAGTQKLDITKSKGTTLGLQTKVKINNKDFYYNIGRSTDKLGGKTTEFGLMKATKREPFDITPKVKSQPIKERYQVVVEKGKDIEHLTGFKEEFAQAPPPRQTITPTQKPIEAGKPLRSQVDIKQPTIIPEKPVEVGTTLIKEGDVVAISGAESGEMFYPPDIAGMVGGTFKGMHINILRGERLKMLDVNTYPKTGYFTGTLGKTEVLSQANQMNVQRIGQIQQPMNIQEPRMDVFAGTTSMNRQTQQTETNLKVMTLTTPITSTLTLTRQRTKEKEPQPPITITPPPFNLETSGKKKREKGGAYVVQLKRKGKFYTVSSPMEKPQALDVLAMKLSRTLGATAKLVPVRQTPVEAQTTGEFSRLKGTFRTYKIQQGQRVPMDNTWIQEAKFRLGTREEVGEIQSSKSMFNKIFGGFKK